MVWMGLKPPSACPFAKAVIGVINHSNLQERLEKSRPRDHFGT